LEQWKCSNEPSPSSLAEAGFLGDGGSNELAKTGQRYSQEEANQELSWLYNNEGKPRIWKLRGHYRNKQIDHEELIRAFKTYSNFNEYVILEKKVYSQSSGELEKSERIAVKSIKKGNDKWKKKIRRKLFSLKEPISQELSKHHGTSNVLFISYTIDHKICSTEEEAWKIIPSSFNVNVTNLRNKFGKLDYVRVVEAQASGYPHIHMLVWFHKKDFEIIKWRNKKDGKITWRVKKKKERKAIKDCWKLGKITDIEAVYGEEGLNLYLGKMFSYLAKDTERVIEKAKTKLNEEQLNQLMNELAKERQKIYLGLALSSLFNKHSFALSHEFLKTRLDSVKNNSNFFGQLLGSENTKFLVIWEFVDLVSQQELLSYGSIKIS
jgi:uncharacterized protein (DUF2249 family)